MEPSREGLAPPVRFPLAGALWTIALLGVLPLMLLDGLRYTIRIQGSHTICGAVPSYSVIQLERGVKTVGLVLNPSAPPVLERLFCAQYDMVPRVVVGVNATREEIWSALQRFPVILDAAGTRNWAETMEALARQQENSGFTVERREYANGLLVLRLRPAGWP